MAMFIKFEENDITRRFRVEIELFINHECCTLEEWNWLRDGWLNFYCARYYLIAGLWELAKRLVNDISKACRNWK